MYDRQQGLCWYCLRECRFPAPEDGDTFSADIFTLDHLVPRSHGGRRSHRNVVGACAECNQAKGNILFDPRLIGRIRNMGPTTRRRRIVWRPWCELEPDPLPKRADDREKVAEPAVPKAGRRKKKKRSRASSASVKREPVFLSVVDGKVRIVPLAERNRDSATQVKKSVVHHAGTTQGQLPSSPGLASRLWQRSLSFLRTLHTRLKRS